MEVNRNIYPQVEKDGNTGYFTHSLSHYPLNTDLDVSITYSASTSGYAPLVNCASVAWAGVDAVSEQGYNITRQFNSFVPVESGVQKIHLIQNTTGRTWNISDNKKFGYSATSLFSDRKLYSDYNFFAQTYCIRCRVMYDITDNNAYYTTMSLSDAFSSSRYKIIGLYLESSNQSSNLATLNQLADCTFDIDEQNQQIKNHQPFSYIMYNTGYGDGVASGNENGIHLFGTAISIFYEGGDTGRARAMLFNTGFAEFITPFREKPHFSIPVFSGTYEDALHIAATVGVPFTDKYNITASGLEDICTNDNVYIPIITDSGLYQGDFARGEAEKRQAKQVTDRWDLPQNWDKPFTNGVPDFEDIDNREFGDDKLTGNGGNTSALTHRYLLTRSQMKQVADYLNNTDKDVMANIVNKLKLNGENPINSVVSVQYIPFDVDSYMEVGSSNVVIGSNLINVGTIENPVALTGTVVTTDTINIDLGKTKIKPINKNFLDYEPYTKYVAYIPYCNFVELDASVITGRELSFSLVCDLVAGSCEGIIRVDGKIYKTVGGSFMTQCSVQGVDSSSYVNGILSSTGKMLSGIGSMVGATTLGIATGNVGLALAGIAGGVGTTALGAYQFQTTPKEYVSTGKSIGLIGQYLPQHICLYRYSCDDISDSNYHNFIGRACEFSATLNSVSGFTVCHNAKINCSGNQAEIDEIKSLLESGVYI